MTGHGEKLSRNQERAIGALLLNPSIAGAAQAIGVAEKTLWRWLQEEGFQEHYRAARKEVINQALGAVQGAISSAVQTLKTIMEDGKAPASSRVSAARAIIDAGLKVAEIEDLVHRIDRIEKSLEDLSCENRG
ncbi:MAG: hypothetical protein K9L59_10120 [Desulfobacterales bacterium]|nr:hypothetical protein [Desulfobacterales bacterium]